MRSRQDVLTFHLPRNRLSAYDEWGILVCKAQSLCSSYLVGLKLGEFSKASFDIFDEGDKLGGGEHVELLHKPSVRSGCDGIGGEAGHARGAGGGGGAGWCYKTWKTRRGSLALGGRLRSRGTSNFSGRALASHCEKA